MERRLCLLRASSSFQTKQTKNMGNQSSDCSVDGASSFNAVRRRPSTAWLINTLPPHDQRCRIAGTLSVEAEIAAVNGCRARDAQLVVVYGRHSTDLSARAKREQLLGLGFVHVEVYVGGLFEWLMLREVFGAEEFPVDGTPPDDLLAFAPAN